MYPSIGKVHTIRKKTFSEEYWDWKERKSKCGTGSRKAAHAARTLSEDMFFQGLEGFSADIMLHFAGIFRGCFRTHTKTDQPV